ncbi:MAG: DNA polymerase [Patescibacteria group bacterium]
MWSHLKEKGVVLPKITAEEISKKVEPVLREMERVGVMIDASILEGLEDKLETRISKLETKVHRLAGREFNINSPLQLAEVLFRDLRLPSTDLKRTKTGVSTAAGELLKLKSRHPIIEPILEYRELAKLVSTYLKPLPRMVDADSRIHTTYGQETSTGRITSANPNLQNIPIKGEYGPEIRRAFVAAPGCKLVAGDYSQIELRIVACLAQDKTMMAAFAGGEDIHAQTASEIFNVPLNRVTSDQRRVAKTVNFGVLYGMSAYGLAQALGISREQAADYIKRYFEIHEGIKKYCHDVIAKVAKDKYTETLFGFRRSFENFNRYNHNLVEAEERMAINAPVQGTAAEILKLAMVELIKKLKEVPHPNPLPADRARESARLILTVHDEIVVEVPARSAEEMARLVKETMESVVKLCVPLKAEVGIGRNWAETK